jgi:hypothetical protein
MHMPSAFPILFGIIHVPFDSFISQNEGNAEMVRVICSRCDRKGQYRKETLIALHGSQEVSLGRVQPSGSAR